MTSLIKKDDIFPTLVRFHQFFILKNLVRLRHSRVFMAMWKLSFVSTKKLRHRLQMFATQICAGELFPTLRFCWLMIRFQTSLLHTGDISDTSFAEQLPRFNHFNKKQLLTTLPIQQRLFDNPQWLLFYRFSFVDSVSTTKTRRTRRDKHPSEPRYPLLQSGVSLQRHSWVEV